jgi:hypothetical protein
MGPSVDGRMQAAADAIDLKRLLGMKQDRRLMNSQRPIRS